MRFKAIVVIAALLLGGFAAAEEGQLAWDSLTIEQQQILQPFADRWDTLPADRQRRLSAGSERWLGMSPRQREAAREPVSYTHLRAHETDS